MPPTGSLPVASVSGSQGFVVVRDSSCPGPTVVPEPEPPGPRGASTLLSGPSLRLDPRTARAGAGAGPFDRLVLVSSWGDRQCGEQP